MNNTSPKNIVPSTENFSLPVSTQAMDTSAKATKPELTKSKPVSPPIGTQCVYDQVLSLSITGKGLAPSLIELESYKLELENERKIQRIKRVHASVIALFAALLAFYELILRGIHNQSPTELLSPLMSLAKKCKVGRLVELQKLFTDFHQQTVVNTNFKDVLGISSNNQDEGV